MLVPPLDETFRVKGYSSIWAIGDCCNLPCLKLGYLALNQGNYLVRTLCNLALRTIDRGSDPWQAPISGLVVSLGRESGIVGGSEGGCCFPYLYGGALSEKRDNMFTKFYSAVYGVSPNYFLKGEEEEEEDGAKLRVRPPNAPIMVKGP